MNYTNSRSRGPVDLKASIRESGETPGANIEVVLQLDVAAGWHVYASVPEGYPSPATTLEIKLPEGVTSVGSWTRPHGVPDTRNPKLKLYRRSVEFSQRLNIAPGTPAAEAVVEIRYQVCNANSCLPPATLQIPVTLPEKSR